MILDTASVKDGHGKELPLLHDVLIQHLRNTVNKDISTAKEKHEKSYAENLLKKIRQWRKELNSATYK